MSLHVEIPSKTALVDVIFVVITGGGKCRWERALLQIAQELLLIIIMCDCYGVKWYLRIEWVRRVSFAAFHSGSLFLSGWLPAQRRKRNLSRARGCLQSSCESLMGIPTAQTLPAEQGILGGFLPELFLWAHTFYN